MIEAPEARVIAAQITDTLQSRTVTDVIANTTPHKFAFFHGDPDTYAALLTGRIIEGAIAVGGMVQINFSGGTRFVLADGSRPRYITPGGKLPQKHQLLIAFDDESCLVFCVQMYGMLWAAAADDNLTHDYYLTALERPNLYSESFTEDYFNELTSDPALQKKSVKALLATEQRIPGLGNGVLQDMLLTAGIHPKRKISTLNANDISRLYRAVRLTADEMLRLGGRDTENDIFGNKGGYVTRLGAKALGEFCPVCGVGPVRREAYLGGNIYYCPECQPLP